MFRIPDYFCQMPDGVDNLNPVDVAIDPSWKEVLEPEFRKPYFHQLTEALKNENPIWKDHLSTR